MHSNWIIYDSHRIIYDFCLTGGGWALTEDFCVTTFDFGSTFDWAAYCLIGDENLLVACFVRSASKF